MERGIHDGCDYKASYNVRDDVWFCNKCGYHTHPSIEGEGERIEGCEVSSMFHTDSRGDVWVNLKLPPGGSLHEMLGFSATLILHPQEPESDD